MATNPVNLIDAIADTIPRISRARTATIRVGKVTIASVAGQVTVQVGGAVNASGQPATIKARYLMGYVPTVGDIVALVTEKDVWLILGRIATT